MRQNLINNILESDIIKKWHWFGYHFNYYLQGVEHPFAKSIVDTLIEIDKYTPGIKDDFVKRIASLSGREKFEPHYEQLMQILAELVIIRKLYTYEWTEKINFEHEPTAGNSKKNPEVCLILPETTIGVEVKSPQILNHKRTREKSKVQLPSRNMLIDIDIVQWAKESNELCLPRDNPVKDFLISANEKFASFKKLDSNFIGFLIIVWDDFVYEPISTLLNDISGIFTPNTFVKTKGGENEKFENVDYVLVTSHLHQFQHLAGERPVLIDIDNVLDYGKVGFPFKIIIKNPYSTKELPANVIKCLQAVESDAKLGAEFVSSDFILWR